MTIHPVVLDSRPPYPAGADRAAAPVSLLLSPLGEGTLLSHVVSRLHGVSPHAPQIVAAADLASAAYRSALREAGPSVGRVSTPSELRARLDELEPSDWLLVVDPRCLPSSGLATEALLRHPADPRWVRHLVAVADDGIRECVQFDGGGRVRRIRRFYDAVTWPFTAGVSCSLLPAACALLADELPWTSLAEMRHALAVRGIPSHDLPIEGRALDLGRESDMLDLGERFIVRAIAAARRRSSSSSVLYTGRGHRVHRSARLVGPVVVQDGAVVDEDATVLGPALIGCGAEVGAGALVAQSVLFGGARVPPGATVRHRVWVAEPPDPEPPAAPRLTVALPRPPARPPKQAQGGHGWQGAHPAGRSSGGRYPDWKPAVEGGLALLALVLLSPLLLLVALVIKLDSRGPVLYGHQREGRHGRTFRCWKFRTMGVGAESLERELRSQSEVDGPQFKLKDDPRITRVGRWLRSTNLDELPQLLNVALGQMSLVGPRPSPFQENQTCVPWREGRLSVRPGITGLWQVCRHDRASGDFHQWIQYDLLYVRHCSLGVDVRILAATLLTGGGRRHVPLSWILPAEATGPDESAVSLAAGR